MSFPVVEEFIEWVWTGPKCCLQEVGSTDRTEWEEGREAEDFQSETRDPDSRLH